MNATDSTRTLRDADARLAIESELDRNVMVLAGAGAGKTHALVGRMIALLRTGRVEVEHIAAITFTRKAAGELRDRFMKRLREELPGTEGTERDRLEAAMARADQCFMGTIHSFCGRLLRERPVEGRVPPDFSELEKEEETRLARQEWDRFISERYAAEDPRLLELDDVGILPEYLYGFFCKRVEVPELALRLVEVPAPDLPAAAREVVAFMSEVREHVPPRLLRGKDDLMKTVDRVLHAARNRGYSTVAEAASILELLKENAGVTLNRWEPDKAYAKQLRDEIYPEFHARVVAPALRQWREHLYPAAAGLVDEAVAAYEAYRRQNGLLTFADLLNAACTMLQTSPEARRYFRARYQTILVDEFQDTDPVQAEILLYLTGTESEETDWRRLIPHPGSLFLVGDEKQSIYRFRRADVATFRFMRDRIEETGGLVLQLNTSFRSLGHLCGWINRAFPPVFGAHEPAHQTAYGELFDFRPAGDDADCVRTIRIGKVDGNSDAAIVRLEAERIANFIRAAIDGRTPYNGEGDGALLGARARPSDFLILTRKKKMLGMYAAALEAVGVPFDLTGGRDLRASEELRALVDLLRVVHEPDNPVFYVGFLRGLFVGLPDDALYRYRQAGGRFDPSLPLPADLPQDLFERISAARALIDASAEAFRRLTPAAAVESISDRTGLAAYARAQPLGSKRAGNLMRVLSLVRTLEDRQMHWGQIVTELQAVVDGDAYELEEMTLAYGSDEAVRIMNVHQAKGLQANVVFLADPYGRDGNHGVDRHVRRVGDDPHLSILIQRGGEYARRTLAQPVGWEEDEEEELLHAAAEDTRLLYVAGTRARNMLVVSVYDPKSTDGRYGPLFPALADVPELEHFAPVTTIDPATGADADAIPERAAQLAAASLPRHARGTVTGEKAAPAAFDGESGRGRDFGTIVHTVLEDAVLGRLPADEKRYVEVLCLESGLGPDATRSVQRLLDLFRKSELWTEIQSAEDVYTEVPVGVVRDESDADTIPVLTRGKIDLIYKVSSGWKIVDYKTDVDAAAGQLPLDVEHYANQIRNYAAYWHAVTGEPVVECGLYGTVGDGGILRIPLSG